MAKQDLTTFMAKANLPELTDEDMVDALDNVLGPQDSLANATTFLSFSGKTNLYSLGRDQSDMDSGDIYLMEPQSVIEGWTCWKGSKPVDRHEWSVYQAHSKAVPERDLTDHGPYREQQGEGWKGMLGFGVMSTDDTPVSIQFTTTSASGRNAVKDLLQEVRSRAKAGEPAIPAMRFDREEFFAQEQRNFKPKFVVDAWLERDAVTAHMDGELTLAALLAGETRATKKKRAKKRT